MPAGGKAGQVAATAHITTTFRLPATHPPTPQLHDPNNLMRTSGYVSVQHPVERGMVRLPGRPLGGRVGGLVGKWMGVPGCRASSTSAAAHHLPSLPSLPGGRLPDARPAARTGAAARPAGASRLGDLLRRSARAGRGGGKPGGGGALPLARQHPHGAAVGGWVGARHVQSMCGCWRGMHVGQGLSLRFTHNPLPATSCPPPACLRPPGAEH